MPPPPTTSAPRPNISINVGPTFAPPLFGPSIFSPPLPLFFPPPVVHVPVPVPSGPSVADQVLQDQQRRDEQVIDGQRQQIQELQKEIAELKAKKQ